MVRCSVSLGLWLDRPAEEVLETAEVADVCGYPELWVGEMATYDAFALATAVGARTRHIDLTVGPLPVTVRDPMMIAMGTASVAGLTGRRCGVALGTSSPAVVERWHGRSRARPARALRESAIAVGQLLAGERGEIDGEVVRTSGYRLRLPPPRGPVTVAAFGPAAVRVAAAHADRMVANLVSVDELAGLGRSLKEAQRDEQRTATRLAVWVPTAVDPAPEAVEQIRRAAVAYLAAPGYGEMFEEAGFGDLVAQARGGARPGELLASVPDELVETVGALGDVDEVMRRLEAYVAAGADEVVIVPSATDADPAGAGTLRALADRLHVRSGPAAAPA